MPCLPTSTERGAAHYEVADVSAYYPKYFTIPSISLEFPAIRVPLVTGDYGRGNWRSTVALDQGEYPNVRTVHELFFRMERGSKPLFLRERNCD